MLILKPSEATNTDVAFKAVKQSQNVPELMRLYYLHILCILICSYKLLRLVDYLSSGLGSVSVISVEASNTKPPTLSPLSLSFQPRAATANEKTCNHAIMRGRVSLAKEK